MVGKGRRVDSDSTHVFPIPIAKIKIILKKESGLDTQYLLKYRFTSIFRNTQSITHRKKKKN